MDRFAVTITGMGAHHTGAPTDIDALLAAFVAQMRASGHADVRCTLTTNAVDERIEPAESPMAQRSAQLAELAVLVAPPAEPTTPDSPAGKRASREA